MSRAAAVAVSLKKLNPYVQVSVVTSAELVDFGEEALRKLNLSVAVFTEACKPGCDAKKLEEVNAACRKLNVGFILTECFGL